MSLALTLTAPVGTRSSNVTNPRPRVSVPVTGAPTGTGFVAAFVGGSSESAGRWSASSSLESAASSGISSGASKFSCYKSRVLLSSATGKNELTTEVFQHLLYSVDYDSRPFRVVIQFEV